MVHRNLKKKNERKKKNENAPAISLNTTTFEENNGSFFHRIKWHNILSNVQS